MKRFIISAGLLSAIAIPFSLKAYNASEGRTQTAQSFWQSSTVTNKDTLKATPLSIKSKPEDKANEITQINLDQGFSVSQGDWVKIKTTDGKQGWALTSEVSKHLQQSYDAAYQVELRGTDQHYTVNKISPQVAKERRIKAQKAAEQRMKRWQRSFFMNPFFDDDSQDEVDALQSQVKKLEAEVKALQTTKK